MSLHILEEEDCYKLVDGDGVVLATEWKESEHPRDEGGQFTSGGNRSVKDIQKEIREHKKEMKDKGIKEMSFMNRQPSMEHQLANERLFALKQELTKAKGVATGAKKVKSFLEEQGVTVEGFSGFGPMTKKVVVDKYNSKYKTKLSVEEFTDAVNKV